MVKQIPLTMEMPFAFSQSMLDILRSVQSGIAGIFRSEWHLQRRVGRGNGNASLASVEEVHYRVLETEQGSYDACTARLLK